MTNMQARFRHILEQVLEKSKADRIAWHRGATSDDAFSAAETFVVGFPNGSVLRISFCSPVTEPDSISAVLQNSSDERIASMHAEDGIDTNDYEFLMQLYEQAHRSATHWDKEFDEVEKALDSESQIGTDPKQSGFAF